MERAPAATTGVFRRDGEVWVVGLGRRLTSVRDSKGLQHIARLLERPGEPVGALELVAAVEGHGRGTDSAVDGELSIGGLGDAGEVLDAQARREYRARLEEAREELEEAERFHDPERAARARLEVEFLARELSAAVGLGGRERRAGSATERARVNVTRSIKSAIDRIATHDEALASHLRAFVRTGGHCVYSPPDELAVEWNAPERAPTLPTASTRAESAEAPAPERPPRRPLPPPLVEREVELARIEAALTSVAGGSGSVLVLQGPAGIGKSSLVAAAAARASALGFRLAQGRGSELERAFAFGVARQLFDPLLQSLPESESSSLGEGAVRPAAAMLGYIDDPAPPAAPEGARDPFPIMNGLYWLAARLGRDAPLALIVDDAHIADDASLTWLAFMTARVSLQPVLLLIASRDAHQKSPPPLKPLLEASAAERILLSPLSEAGVAALVRRTWPDASPQFCAACHSASGGNPFYVRELVAAASASGVAPDADGARQLRDITPEAVTRLVLSRLEGLPPEARQLAEACAILDSPDLALAAGVAGMDERAALAAVDALVAEGIVEPAWPLRFTHPLLAAAVDRETGLGAQTVLRERAAEMLAARGAPATEIAVHLFHARPSGRPEWVECLRAAAQEAAARAAPETAVEMLERALGEIPPPEQIPSLLLELARARRDAGDRAGAVNDLERALTLTRDPALRGELALELSGHDAWGVASRVALVDEALSGLGDDERELRFSLEARAIELLNDAAAQSTSPAARRIHDERLARVVATADGTTAGERQLIAIYAGDRAVRADIAAGEAKAMALRALDDGSLMRRLAEGVWTCDAAIEVLTMTDAFDVADRHAREAERQARRHGAVGAAGWIAMLRAIVAWHRGALLEAEALLRSVFAACAQVPEPYVQYVAHQIQACVCVEFGDFEAAQAASDAIEREGLAPMGAPHVRGRLHAARGDAHLAVPDLRAAFELQHSAGRWRSVVMGSPRQELALALVTVGARDEALALAQEEHAAASRFGAPTSVAAALRTLGHAEADEEEAGGRVERFEAAADALAGSQAALARAYVLVDLGSAQRLQGDTAAARRTLRDALELCRHSGAKRLAERARAELLAAGGKPVIVSPRATELLSPAERHILSLAAEGASEVEIAEALFLSVPAAAAQLASALTKLEVDSPEELEQVLATLA